ncbi:hypothetical protein ACFFRR_004435 [Megaselia abdita]
MKFNSVVIFVILVTSSVSAQFGIQQHVKCGQDKAGKLIEMEPESYKMYKICVNPQKSETYFVYHKLGYRFKNHRKDLNDEVCFLNRSLQTTEYSRVIDVFDKKRNREYFDRKDLKKNLHFSPFQFAPCEDFSDPQEKLATFFVENTAPGFDRILKGNWAFVEKTVRNRITEETEIITGQFGQLRLLNKNGANVNIVLEDSMVGQTKNSKQPYNEVKVPEFFYKIVKNSKDSYVMITSNNPFISSLSDDKRLCKVDLCEHPLRFKDFFMGYTYCCTLKEFTKNLKLHHNIDFAGIISPSTEDYVEQDLVERDGNHEGQKMIDLI